AGVDRGGAGGGAQRAVGRDGDHAVVDDHVTGPRRVVIIDGDDTGTVFIEIAGAEDGPVEIRGPPAVDVDLVSVGVEGAVEAECAEGVVVDAQFFEQVDVD